MNVGTVREFRHLQHENARLKKLLTDRELEIDAMEEMMRKRGVNSEAGENFVLREWSEGEYLYGVIQ